MLLRRALTAFARGPYATLGGADLAAFEAMVPGRVLSSADDVLPYTEGLCCD